MQVTALVVTTDTPAPAGQTYASTTLTLTDGAGGVQAAPVGPITLADGTIAQGAVFTVTVVGDGTVLAQAIDTTGAVMGATATGAFTIPAAPSFPQPAAVTVTLS